ncbi:MAG TPA: MarR family transcriptional regulator [Oscillatoriaceae cyanobacterium]
MGVQNCPCFNLGLAHRRVVRLYEEALAPLGLTIAQAHFLSCLFERDAMLAKDLAAALRVDAGTLTPMIDRMERQGMIRRCPCPGDRRAVRICLESAGRKLKPEIEARCGEVAVRLASKLSEEDYTRFMAIMKQIGDEEAEPAGLDEACSAGR